MTASCVHCGARLREEPCGCWTDGNGTRWCGHGDRMHEPQFGTQPKTCGATL